MAALPAIKITKIQAKSLADNLKLLLENRHLSESAVAQALDIPVMTVRRLISGETADPRISTLKLLADYFEVSVDALLVQHDTGVAGLLHKSKPCFVPILDWNTAAKMVDITDLDLSHWGEWQPVSLNHPEAMSSHAFALESRPSMQPRFPAGTLFIIDPEESPTDGDLIIMKMKGEENLSLREVVVDLPKWQLHPVISGSEMISYSKEKHVIVGVVILTMLHTRRKTSNETAK